MLTLIHTFCPCLLSLSNISSSFISLKNFPVGGNSFVKFFSRINVFIKYYTLDLFLTTTNRPGKFDK